MFKFPLQYSKEVLDALANKQPVVALESTIITHGMEYPINLQTALSVEEVIRQHNAVPATIAILGGIINIGLSNAQIEEIAKNKATFLKCSRRDLSSIIANKGNGSTTVATTMMCAAWAGIRVFVTGGIGGVHRQAETTFDISADLLELGQTQVAVVCAGAKSILDIPKTLEYLETQGVPVVGYGTNKFPNFFTSDSGCLSSHSVDNANQAALLIQTQFSILNLKNGMLFAVPIPQEEAADGHDIQQSTEQALLEAHGQNITGAQITPFLLKRIHELTHGRSSTSNVALIKNNAKVGAQIAVELSKLMLQQ